PLSRATTVALAITLLSMAPALLGTLASPARAYGPAEVRAILMQAQNPLPDSVGRVVLATQRSLDLLGNGGISMEEHTIERAGPRRPEEFPNPAWYFRPRIDSLLISVATIHRADGTQEPVPRDSIRREPVEGAGPGGYPGIQKLAMHLPPLRSGDALEVHLAGASVPLSRIEQVAGEHLFADQDSVVESELIVRFPTVLSMIGWRMGGLPPAERSTLGGNYEARWLVGHLPPSVPTYRTVSGRLTGTAPDSLGPMLLEYGFQADWRSVVRPKRIFWRHVLERSEPEILAGVAREIAQATIDPRERMQRAIAWTDANLKPLSIPAAQLWFEPADPDAVVRSGFAIPRDRAAILVWLLRRLGVRADAVTVSSRGNPALQLTFPQQLDLWTVRAQAGSDPETWVDLRSGTQQPASSVPAGPGLLWTVKTEDEDPIVSFPGLPPLPVTGRP
ncbi:MAG: hypothetical protein QUU85_19100, partial [Candidatus Eisenbacteria bacterium]|nr:hypothetical protein [Candidatus Eisenbacteria bacterium]